MAVICRTECLLISIRRKNWIQGIVLILVLIGAQHCVQSEPQCDQAKEEFSRLGLSNSLFLDVPTRGEYCGESSCCPPSVENALLVRSKKQLDNFLRDSVQKLSSLFDVRAKKFDGFFREMMNNSRIEFHEMFQKTYGKIYLQNSDVFSDFFKELEQYYKKGTNRLTDILENFFEILYQRMFTVINSQYHFDKDYLQCVSDHLEMVKPFGDLPHKFTVELRRSFVATRTYYKALSTASEVAKKIQNVSFDKECEKVLVQMQYCSSCKGQKVQGTCSSYCVETVQACLKQHLALSTEWDNFIEALDKVADRLAGPFNIETVVEPLNIKISEVIMSFQESGTEVSKRIYNMCGKPSLTRRKRKVDFKDAVETRASTEIKYEPVKMHGGHKRKKTKKHQDEENNVPTLVKLIKEIKSKVRETRQFWAHLPYQYCNNMTAPPGVNGTCWDGTVNTWKPTPSPLIQEQVFALQVFTDTLRKAYQGEEVVITDDAEDEEVGSGSGSGDFAVYDDVEDGEERGNLGQNPKINEIPEDPQPPPSTTRPEVTRTFSGGASTISLSKALVQYLLPIVLVWFGGAISDLL